MFDNIYKGKRVLITGHTGFKGSWLCAWLLDLGATVAGYSVDVPTEPSHFEALALADRIEHFQGDVREKSSLQEAMNQFRPEIVFHWLHSHWSENLTKTRFLLLKPTPWEP